MSEWGTPIVPVLKRDGSVRICGDYKITLNPYLKNVSYPLPRIEDLFSKLAGGKYFTKIDLSSAYQQILLSEQAKSLSTISTHLGLFAYNRMPYGIKTAPSIFQLIMEKVLIGLEGVTCFLDDILIAGRNKEEHLLRIDLVLNKLEKYGLTVRREKCNFFQKSVNYLGFVIDEEGLRPSTEKVDALLKAIPPRNKSELKSVLGMFNYYRAFIPNFASMCEPLYRLLKDESSWIWNKTCDQAFETLKKTISSKHVLAHYDSAVPVKLTVDASSTAVGAILTHRYENGKERPIAFASKILTTTQRAYSQIDKEAYSIIFGVSKFTQYLYGRHFVLVTDHKPLLSIFGPKKGIPIMAANRLQRYAVFLSAFDYTIEYVKSDKNVADCLSRLIEDNQTEMKNYLDDDDENFTYLNLIEKQDIFRLDKKVIQEETRNDEILRKVFEFASQGWPSDCKEEELKPYYIRRDQITIEDNLLMWGHRLIIPSRCRKEVLKEIHSTHMGIVKSKSLTRSFVWWPSCDKNVEEFCKNCLACSKHRNSPPKAEVIEWPKTEQPWERVHIDFFGPLHNKMFMIVVDSHSKWIEVVYMKNITSENTVDKLREIFSRWGLPKIVVTDNGRSFVSECFKHFLYMNGIQHITPPPYHPATNGLAEVSEQHSQ
ncbi:uncharacterized protein K02A2.6-like [Photinus pyralis]|uniref:uncharacterized protein K02A2.6-like n=2 Tax=Photinus pyralis TaxID=7054 RepID=UPI0012676ED0|nr:uncharacterized protein K02A2.6-like [Photinus pyralis]